MDKGGAEDVEMPMWRMPGTRMRKPCKVQQIFALECIASCAAGKETTGSAYQRGAGGCKIQEDRKNTQKDKEGRLLEKVLMTIIPVQLLYEAVPVLVCGLILLLVLWRGKGK